MSKNIENISINGKKPTHIQDVLTKKKTTVHRFRKINPRQVGRVHK